MLPVSQSSESKEEGSTPEEGGRCGYLWFDGPVHGGRLGGRAPVGVGGIGAGGHRRLRGLDLRGFDLSRLGRALDVLPVPIIRLQRTHRRISSGLEQSLSWSPFYKNPLTHL